MVGDEINRASPKTQSALLECMEERQVTVDNTTYQLDTPFMVIATQNPIEMEGTYALPEAQRDRFMARVSVGYPVEAAEIAMLDSHTGDQPARRPRAGHRRRRGPQADRRSCGQVHVSEAVQRYAVALDRGHPAFRGADPGRLAARDAAPGARRQGAGRDRRAATTCSPTTSTRLARPVLAHRLLPSVEAAMSGRSTTSHPRRHRRGRARPRGDPCVRHSPA